MRNLRLEFVGLMSALLGLTLACDRTERGRQYPLQAVELGQVEIQDTFWNSRIRTVRQVTLSHAFGQLESLGRLDNFDRAAGLKNGTFQGNYPFDDSDVYKTVEAASYALLIQPDPQLESFLDGWIARIAAAQASDGYIMTWRQIDPGRPPTDWSGNENRWSDLQNGHELYNAGHLYEAAAAHFRATGKKSLLDVALKNAELVCRVFGPGRNERPPGHEEIEMALVRLYQTTGEERYLRQAEFFLTARGRQKYDSSSTDIYENGMYWQDHKPVVEQREAVGHAVRAGYLYSAMTDIAALRNVRSHRLAVEAIWEDIVSGKQYLTGAVGPQRKGESFGERYDLPNSDAYNESCAAIANVLWNHRMSLLTGEAKYHDVLERALYNGAISGLSLRGDAFFYCNPLSSGVEESWNTVRARPAWQKCACCPPNLARFILSMPRYILSVGTEALDINLFVASSASVTVNGVRTAVFQKTDYPWDGRVEVGISPEQAVEFTLRIRIPGWAREEPLAGGLYSFLEADPARVEILVNGERLRGESVDGWVEIRRTWRPGDRIALQLPMPVRLVASDPRVEANRGRVALQRGPIVYCAESADNPNGIGEISLPRDVRFEPVFQPDLLNGLVVLRETAGSGSDEQLPLVAIPYYAWAHRGEGQMAVWLRHE